MSDHHNILGRFAQSIGERVSENARKAAYSKGTEKLARDRTGWDSAERLNQGLNFWGTTVMANDVYGRKGIKAPSTAGHLIREYRKESKKKRK